TRTPLWDQGTLYAVTHCFPEACNRLKASNFGTFRNFDRIGKTPSKIARRYEIVRSGHKHGPSSPSIGAALPQPEQRLSEEAAAGSRSPGAAARRSGRQGGLRRSALRENGTPPAPRPRGRLGRGRPAPPGFRGWLAR